MKKRDIISLISTIREMSNRFIIGEMGEYGLKGLSTSHGDILYALFSREAMTMKEISEKIQRDKSTVTALIDKLSALGYVTREKDAEDSRITLIRLTENGKALKPVFEEISHKLINKVYEGVEEEEKEVLLDILQRIRDNF